MPIFYQDGDMEIGINTSSASAELKSPCALPGGASMEVAIAAPSSDTGLGAVVMARIAAVSHYTDIRYWSQTRSRWRELVTEARVLAAPNGSERGDPEPRELVAGSEFYIAQQENTPAGDVVYRVSVAENASDRLVLDVANALPVRYLGVTMFAPGEYAFHHEFTRKADGTWGYNGRLSIHCCGSSLMEDRAISFATRMAALASFLMGRPTTSPPVRIH